MAIPKGGRGKKELYESSVIRVPNDIIDEVKLISDEVKELIIEGKTIDVDFLKKELRSVVYDKSSRSVKG